MTRSEAREKAFFILFEKIFNDDLPVSQIIDDAESNDFIKINNFARNILDITEANQAEIDALISENSRGWNITRLPKVSLAILRLAIGEMKYCDEVPVGVSVNEAVELTKKYGTPDDASFVNGILGTISKSL